MQPDAISAAQVQPQPWAGGARASESTDESFAATDRKQDRPAPKKGPGLVDVVAAKKRGRWEEPALGGPEFGGLIERRGVDSRGLMPQPWKPQTDPQHKPRQPSQLGADPGHVKVSEGIAGEDATESTGMFLAALDNSAITLADSGLFKMAEQVEQDTPEETAQGCDPYDRSRSQG